jgi:hypothetical protein
MEEINYKIILKGIVLTPILMIMGAISVPIIIYDLTREKILNRMRK